MVALLHQANVYTKLSIKMTFSRILVCNIFIMFFSNFYVQSEAAVKGIPVLNNLAASTKISLKMTFSKLLVCSIFLMFFSTFYIQSEAAVSRIPVLNNLEASTKSLGGNLAYMKHIEYMLLKFLIFLLISFFNYYLHDAFQEP